MPVDVLILLLRLAMVLALYAFLLSVLSVIRRDLHRAAAGTVPEPPRGEDRLLVVDPGATSLRVGAAFELSGPTTLGRARDNAIVLDDGYVSARHARLTPRDGVWLLADLGSTNGTRLNERPVRGEVRVAPGDVIALGSVRLKLVRPENRR